MPAALASDHPTGLERASQATQQGLEKAQGHASAAPGQANRAQGLDKAGKGSSNGNKKDKLRGLERAAAAINTALERGNGRGNAFGRGHAADVHAILLAGGSPSEIAGEHGAAVSAMVRAYNQLKRAERQPGD